MAHACSTSPKTLMHPKSSQARFRGRKSEGARRKPLFAAVSATTSHHRVDFLSGPRHEQAKLPLELAQCPQQARACMQLDLVLIGAK